MYANSGSYAHFIWLGGLSEMTMHGVQSLLFLIPIREEAYSVGRE